MIRLFRPCIPVDEVLVELRPVLESGWIEPGPKVKEFEQEFARRVGARFGVSTHSGTAALHLAAKALGLAPGSKVLTTPVTFISTNMVLLYEHLTPVFCDVEERTGNIDFHSVESLARQHKPAAIMVVHLGGYPCDLDAINGLAEELKIPVIEDCAHALGATYRGKRIGDTNNLCCWSFQATQNLPTGDGGMITTHSEAVAGRLRRLRSMGIDKSTVERSREGKSRIYSVEHLGYRYHMNDLAATIGLVMLRHLDEHNRRRAEIAARYQANLGGYAPAYRDDRQSSYHFVPMFFPHRDAMRQKLEAAGIEWGYHYAPNYEFTGVFVDCEAPPHARQYSTLELTLPLHPSLTDEEVDTIIAVVKS